MSTSEKFEKNKNTNISKIDEIILRQQTEEWKYLNDYIIKMDLGYGNFITIALACFTGVLAVFLSADIEIAQSEYLKWIFYILPPIIITVFGYMSYQFRITAILRGHLASLEKSMNSTLGKNVHIWNSALVEVLLAHNNPINQQMMYPCFLTAGILATFCIYITLENCGDDQTLIFICILYWVVMVFMILIVSIPFLKNYRARYDAENDELINKMYKKYLKNRKYDSIIDETV